MCYLKPFLLYQMIVVNEYSDIKDTVVTLNQYGVIWNKITVVAACCY